MEISELFVYPLKSAAGIALDSMSLDRLGPVYDRRWMLVDDNNKFLTQRQFPQMALIRTSLRDDTINLELPGGITGELESDGYGSRAVTVWSDRVEALECNHVLSEAISGFLGRSCQLVYIPETGTRLIDQEYTNEATGPEPQPCVSFADGFPLLVVSQASLDAFNDTLGFEISMNHFRPNIVISGNSAFEEDSWKQIRLGDVVLDIVKPCSRCVIPSINPLTAEKDSRINRALASSRRIFQTDGDMATYFGQNAIHRSTGLLSTGDKVEILK